MATLFLAILVIAVAVIFSAQNAIPVTLKFVTWRFSASLAIVVFLSVLTGMVIMGLLWMRASFRKRLKRKEKSSDTAAAKEKDGPSTQDTVKGP